MATRKTLKLFLSVLLILCINGLALSQDTIIRYKTPIVPDYLNFQFAGNVGAYVIGVGYSMNRKKNLEMIISYGISLPHHAARRIHNIALKAVFIPVTFDLHKDWMLSLKTGLGLSRQFPEGTNTFTRLPKTFPDGYYAPNAFRGHFFLGAKTRKKLGDKYIIKAVDFYAETTTNDQYVMYMVNSHHVRINDIFSLALGVNLLLYNK